MVSLGGAFAASYWYRSGAEQTEMIMVPYHPEKERGWVVGATFDGSMRRWRLARTLKRMQADPEAAGHSDIGIQNLIFTLTVNLRPRRVLEIGSHIGMGTVIMGMR